MVYTVKKLAKLSGVSVRTLHFYDEIGLLKPAYYGDNNYRYYAEKELLILQQILFYRELGFQLNDIKRIMASPDFDKVKALEEHKLILQKSLNQTNQLIKTVNKTIAHLKGIETMKLDEIFHGFNAEKQKLYEDFLVNRGVDQSVIEKSKKKTSQWSKEEWFAIKAEGDQIYTDLVNAINQNLSADSAPVQQLIKKHYQFTTYFWTPTKETYIGLSELYASHPDFVKFYDNIHPKLLAFLMAAMKIYAERELK